MPLYDWDVSLFSQSPLPLVGSACELIQFLFSWGLVIFLFSSFFFVSDLVFLPVAVEERQQGYFRPFQAGFRDGCGSSPALLRFLDASNPRPLNTINFIFS